MGRLARFLVGPLIAAVAVAVGYFVRLDARPDLAFDPGPRPQSPRPFSYDDYAAVLLAHVNDAGLVDYQGLRRDQELLEGFLRDVAHLDPAEYARWSESEQIAFWLNAYNAMTLEVILKHLPREGSTDGAFKTPAGIRDIPGAWNQQRFMVMGRFMTLDEIEHETLRRKFSDPRIHAGLNCGAVGCPPLPAVPFVGPRLAEQLEEQTRRFLSRNQQFRIDREHGRVFLSQIFQWYGQDFVNRYAPEDGFGSFDRKERAVLSFISRYVNPEDAEYLREGQFRIDYVEYDWSLNAQSGRAGLSSRPVDVE